MNTNFSRAIGNLLAHFYTNHSIALTESEVWLINNMLQCSDETFNAMEMIADVIGISLDRSDIKALMQYEWELTIWNAPRIVNEAAGRFCPN